MFLLANHANSWHPQPAAVCRSSQLSTRAPCRSISRENVANVKLKAPEAPRDRSSRNGCPGPGRAAICRRRTSTSLSPIQAGLSRCRFNRTSAPAAGGATFGVPVLLRGRNLNGKLDIAVVGAAGKGARHTDCRAGENIVAVCDADRRNCAGWHHLEQIAAIKEDRPQRCYSRFDFAADLAESVLLGCVALRAGNKLEWRGAAPRVTNAPEADHFLKRNNRHGWPAWKYSTIWMPHFPSPSPRVWCNTEGRPSRAWPDVRPPSQVPGPPSPGLALPRSVQQACSRRAI